MESPIIDTLLQNYDRVMYLKVFVDNDDDLKKMYLASAENHNRNLFKTNFINAGFDLYAPGPESENMEEEYEDKIPCFGPYWEDDGPVNKVNFKIKCAAKMYTDTNKIYNTGYYMYPRSSLSKTPLRLANSVGIIDSGYRGHIIGMFDVVNICETEENIDRDADYFIEKYDRLVQICAPGLVPIFAEIVNTLEELGERTERGSGGFGSTGK